jgi:hypothetical protein
MNGATTLAPLKAQSALVLEGRTPRPPVRSMTRPLTCPPARQPARFPQGQMLRPIRTCPTQPLSVHSAQHEWKASGPLPAADPSRRIRVSQLIQALGPERLPLASARGSRSSWLFSRASSSDPMILSGRDLRSCGGSEVSHSMSERRSGLRNREPHQKFTTC